MTIDQILANQTYSLIVKYILCIAAGLIIGLEREYRKKSAGVSTHAFVIGGAATIAIISSLIQNQALLAAVITGIGFLGAGIIMRGQDPKQDGRVTNLTTAASIWFSAGIGILIGLGYFNMAVIATFFSVIALEFHEIFGLNQIIH
jgi:putative Mg2+ transporter-C (MgtC) family protein